MKANIIKIGNSRGVRIPRPLIEQLGLGKVVSMTTENGRLVIQNPKQPRKDWEAAFKENAKAAEDPSPYEAPPPTRFDREEWEW